MGPKKNIAEVHGGHYGRKVTLLLYKGFFVRIAGVRLQLGSEKIIT